jgi:hypothetical protein
MTLVLNCPCVNGQNVSYWTEVDPQELRLIPPYSQSATVWCGIYAFGIIGPYFFDDDSSVVIVISDRYVNIRNEFRFPQLGFCGIDSNKSLIPSKAV